MLPEKCSCEDGSDIEPNELPLDGETFLEKLRTLRNVIKKCRPKSCQCPDGSEKKITSFGCPEGGVPRCQSEEMAKIQCSNGDKVTKLKIISSKLKGECICDDGKRPTCGDSGDILRCPNGDLPSQDSPVAEIISQCSDSE